MNPNQDETSEQGSSQRQPSLEQEFTRREERQDDVLLARRKAIRAFAGAATGAFPSGGLALLRSDWPE